MILLDARLTGLDGWQVGDKLLHDPRTRGIPTVLLSANPDKLDGEKALAHGVAYILKPFDPLALADTLEAILASAPK